MLQVAACEQAQQHANDLLKTASSLGCMALLSFLVRQHLACDLWHRQQDYLTE